MSTKERSVKAKLAALIREQAADQSRVYVYPENIRQKTPDPLGEYLTPRQEAILRLMVAGMRRKRIARALRILPATVKSLRKEAFRRLPPEVQTVLSRRS